MLNKGAINIYTGLGVLGTLAFVVFALIPETGCGCSGPWARNFSNIGVLAEANTLYMADNDGEGADPAKWMDQLVPYVHDEKTLHRPRLRSQDEYGYAFLDDLGRVRDADVERPETVPAVFDSTDLSRNAHGSLSLLPGPPVWEGVFVIGFLDGHVKALKVRPRFQIRADRKAP